MTNKIVFFSGAGISAPSGIETFRGGANATWNNYNVEDVATESTYLKNRELVFEFYNKMRHGLQDVQPNAAHYMIADLQKEYGKDRVINVTQNVDDLFEQAGVEDTIHVHGFLTEMWCTKCQHTWDVGYEMTAPTDECPNCGKSWTRPNIVFFGGFAPKYAYMNRAMSNLTEDDICVIIGTDGVVVDLTFEYDFEFQSLLSSMEETSMDESKFNEIVRGCCAENVDTIRDWVTERLT